MCMCSFGGSAVLQTYDPDKSKVKKFRFVPGQGLQVLSVEAAPSEARRPGNKFWRDGAQPGSGGTSLTSIGVPEPAE